MNKPVRFFAINLSRPPIPRPAFFLPLRWALYLLLALVTAPAWPTDVVSSLYVTATARGPGKVIPKGRIAVPLDQDISFSFQPRGDAYEVQSVKVDGTSVGQPASYTFHQVNAPHTLKVVFARKKLEVVVTNQNPSAGHLQPSRTLQQVPYGASRIFTAKPKRGNLAVIRLDGNDVVQGRLNQRISYKLKHITAPHTLDALFVPSYTPPDPTTGGALNDTGVTRCGNAITNDAACNDAAAGTDQYPGQDAEQGRDASANAEADGHAGFSFIKLDGNGTALADQSASYATTPWSCVQDQVTGLMWEVKTDDGSLRDKDWRYSWYNSTGIHAGRSGGKPNGGTCVDTANCDTEKYVALVNAAVLCGRTDWRVPNRAELLSLVDYGAAAPPLIDGGFFPNSDAEPFWSTLPAGIDGSWSVDFASGDARSDHQSANHSLRLVRGGY